MFFLDWGPWQLFLSSPGCNTVSSQDPVLVFHLINSLLLAARGARSLREAPVARHPRSAGRWFSAMQSARRCRSVAPDGVLWEHEHGADYNVRSRTRQA